MLSTFMEHFIIIIISSSSSSSISISIIIIIISSSIPSRYALMVKVYQLSFLYTQTWFSKYDVINDLFNSVVCSRFTNVCQ